MLWKVTSRKKSAKKCAAKVAPPWRASRACIQSICRRLSSLFFNSDWFFTRHKNLRVFSFPLSSSVFRSAKILEKCLDWGKGLSLGSESFRFLQYIFISTGNFYCWIFFYAQEISGISLIEMQLWPWNCAELLEILDFLFPLTNL